MERSGRPPAHLTVDEMSAPAAKFGVQHIYFIDRAHRVFNANLACVKGIDFPKGGFSDDAIMALFEDADDGVRAGLDMLEALGGFNERRAAGGLPPVSIGTGIKQGP